MPMTTIFRRPAQRCGSHWPRHSCRNSQSGEIFLMRRSTAALLHGSTILLLAAATQANAAEKVSIYRDDFGVPHVQAETSDAVMFGAGAELGRAACRGSVGRYVSISVVAVSLKKYHPNDAKSIE